MKILITESQLKSLINSEKQNLINEDVKYNSSSWNSNAELIYNRLKQHGLPEKSIAAVMSNLYAESRFQPKAVGDKNMAGGSSVGIAQWRESRKKGLINFAKKKGKSPDDIATQVDYLMHEIKTIPFYSSTKQALFNPNLSTKDTAAIFTKNYERPANSTQEGLKRGSIAVQMISKHKSKFPNIFGKLFKPKKLDVMGDLKKFLEF